jgi:hypothetical protein
MLLDSLLQIANIVAAVLLHNTSSCSRRAGGRLLDDGLQLAALLEGCCIATHLHFELTPGEGRGTTP